MDTASTGIDALSLHDALPISPLFHPEAMGNTVPEGTTVFTHLMRRLYTTPRINAC